MSEMDIPNAELAHLNRNDRWQTFRAKRGEKKRQTIKGRVNSVGEELQHTFTTAREALKAEHPEEYVLGINVFELLKATKQWMNRKNIRLEEPYERLAVAGWDKKAVLDREALLADIVAAKDIIDDDQHMALNCISTEAGAVFETSPDAFANGFLFYSYLLRTLDKYHRKLEFDVDTVLNNWGNDPIDLQLNCLANITQQMLPYIYEFFQGRENLDELAPLSRLRPAMHIGEDKDLFRVDEDDARLYLVAAGAGFAYTLHYETLHSIENTARRVAEISPSTELPLI